MRPFESWSTYYYCGRGGTYIDRHEVIDLKPLTKEENLSADHCKRCLMAKRKHKGDAYMIENGYPLIDSPLKGRLE